MGEPCLELPMAIAGSWRRRLLPVAQGRESCFQWLLCRSDWPLRPFQPTLPPLLPIAVLMFRPSGGALAGGASEPWAPFLPTSSGRFLKSTSPFYPSSTSRGSSSGLRLGTTILRRTHGCWKRGQNAGQEAPLTLFSGPCGDEEEGGILASPVASAATVSLCELPTPSPRGSPPPSPKAGRLTSKPPDPSNMSPVVRNSAQPSRRRAPSALRRPLPRGSVTSVPVPVQYG